MHYIFNYTHDLAKYWKINKKNLLTGENKVQIIIDKNKLEMNQLKKNRRIFVVMKYESMKCVKPDFGF